MGSFRSTDIILGALQFKPEFLKVEENLRKISKMVRKFEGDILVLPELAFSGYLFKDEEELFRASEWNETIFDEMKNLSKSKNMVIVFGFAERSDDGFYNSCSVVLPNGSTFLYRKTHLFHREKLFFLPGNTGFMVVEYEGMRIGSAICFDWFFPESFRTLAILGADVIAHCANLVMPYCQNASVYRALENRIYIATANRWGIERNGSDELRFTGMSQIVSPKGEVLVRANEEGDVIISSKVDLNLSRDKRLNEFNDVMKDRREMMYFRGRKYKEDEKD